MQVAIAKSLQLAASGGWLAALGALVYMFLASGETRSAPPQGISRTAYSAMAYRAVGGQDPDPATRNPDYLAIRLCNPAIIQDRLGLSLDFREAIKEIERRKRYLFYYVTARTKHMDRILAQALAQGAQQVVILGAGFDTRSHRFHAGRPQVRFFEVDTPAMVRIKQGLVRERLGDSPPTLSYVPLDFATQRLDREMARAGFNREAKTLFIWEGVAMYLEAEAVAATFGFVAANSGGGSLVAFDFVLPAALAGSGKESQPGEKGADRFTKLGEPMKWGIEPAELQRFLAGQGLELAQVMEPEQISARYLTGSDGALLGRLPAVSWFALARAPEAARG
ncbi:hypothetical protein AAU61_10900 [Desulfocarbo indianensis]|nr:hypothetical protein AAU61_10900 [Desulfocarbo indianensis]